MSQPAEPMMYVLSDFASLFEVAVSLNLVFAIWDDIRNNALQRFRRVSDSLNSELELTLGESYKNSRCANKFQEQQAIYIHRLETISVVAKLSGFIVATLLLFLIVLIGYQPALSVKFWVISSFVVISLVPTSFLLVAGYCVVKFSKDSLEAYKEQQTNAFKDLKEHALKEMQAAVGDK